MAYVTVPKDLARVKSKIVFGLTKRQLICFGGALLVGVPLYFLLRGRVTGSAAALIMVFAMLPGFLLALYERHGQPLEVVVWQIVQCCFIQPKERPYQTDNAYTALMRQHQMEKEVNAIVRKAKKRAACNLTPGWKEIERRFKASFKTDADEDAPELARELPELTEGQTFDPVEASITEHFTTPPKPYTEDTLLSAMERAGAEDMPEDAERQGLGTPATRASILEKLVQMGFVERKGKQLLPTKDGHNLVCVLPDVLTSPQLTAEWETKLTAIAKGEADPEGFMSGIEEMTRSLISRYSQISEDAQKLFQAERVVIGKCPRCGEAVYEGKKNYYCGNRACQFVMWKNDRFFEERGKTFTPKIAAALLKDGKAKVKGLRSMKTGKTYDGTVLLADTGGKYVNYRVEKRS